MTGNDGRDPLAARGDRRVRQSSERRQKQSGPGSNEPVAEVDFVDLPRGDLGEFLDEVDLPRDPVFGEPLLADRLDVGGQRIVRADATAVTRSPRRS